MRYLRSTILGGLFCAWVPGAAYAAIIAVDPLNPLAIPPALAMATLFFSTLVGLTTLAIRVLAELKKDVDKPLPKPWLFAAAHMLGSWSAGALGFVTCMGMGRGPWELIATVMVFSFVGSKAFEKAAEKMGLGAVNSVTGTT